MNERRDRARGVLLGMAAGDRIGGPIRMAVRVAESLVDRQSFDPEDILMRYLTWWHEGAFDTGPTTEEVLRRIEDGQERRRAVAQVHDESGGLSAGCNPAHRAVALAMAAFLPDDTLARCASEEAALTHHDPLAGDVSAAVVVLCRALVRGEPWEAAVARAASGRRELTVRALAPTSPEALSPGGFAPEVLRAAVHFTGRHTTFADAQTASLTFAGPANYAPVLVGALAGARWGAQAIPAAMLPRDGIRNRAVAVAEALARDWDDDA